MGEISLQGVSKRFGDVVAMDDITLTVRKSEFMVLLGPSGCGKTTLLRTIAGLETPDDGAVLMNGRDVTDVSAGKRGVAMVFQSYALFPHLKVAENIAFGLRMQRVSNPEIRRRVSEAAEMVQLERSLGRYPSQLSGGERQRVAVARALVVEPSVILMDEPLSSLDALLREQMRSELKELLHEVRATTVYVTHDQSEALSMADRIAVMRSGRILQVDQPARIYDQPADVFVAQFIGSPGMNVLRGTVTAAGVEVEGSAVEATPPAGTQVGGALTLGVRAEHVEVFLEPGDGRIPATVAVVELQGTHLLLTVHLGGQRLRAAARTDLRVAPGDPVWLQIHAGAIRLLAGG